MLYISRRVSTTKFGVVDTDDGTEEVVTREYLVDAIEQWGLDIKGVDCMQRIVDGRVHRILNEVRVYQNDDSISSNATKLNVLTGVEVVRHGDMITGVRWDTARTTPATKIKLSSYGTSCGDVIFGDQGYTTTPSLTVVLDDSLKVTGKTFNGVRYRGAAFDIREVKSQKIVEYVYREFVSNPYVLGSLSDFVIDNRERQDYYRGVFVMTRQHNINPQLVHIRDLNLDAKKVSDGMAKRYGKEFLAISQAKYVGKSMQIQPDNEGRELLKWMMRPENLTLPLSRDFACVRLSQYYKLFDLMRKCSTCNKGVLTRFENFIKFFIVPPEYEEAFCVFCERAGQWALARSGFMKEVQIRAICKQGH